MNCGVMIIFDFLKSKQKTKINNKAVSWNDEEFFEMFGIDPDALNVKGTKALKETTIFSCIRILSGAVAKLPLKIYQDQNGIRKASDHYLYPLLKLRPNPYMSASDFFKCVETQRNIYGNAYVNIEFIKSGQNKGSVVALWPIDSSAVEIFIDKDGLEGTGNKLWYLVNVNGETIKLRQSEVLHFKGVTSDGITGISPITNLRTTIENAAAGAEYINKFFSNGMQSKGIVQYTGDLSPAGQDVFRNRFERMSKGLKNAHRIAMMPTGYQYMPLKTTLADAQFIENSQLTIRQIAAAYGVKMHQLNDLDRATHTNISEQQREFYIDTLMDILNAYEQEMNYKLFLDSEIKAGYYCKFNVDAITRADIKTRYEAYRIGVQGGFIAPNEARDREEWEPKEGGDDLYANGNFIKLKDVGSQQKGVN